jgi:Kelch motif
MFTFQNQAYAESSPASWTLNPVSLPAPNAEFGFVVYNNFAYITGGTLVNGINTVYYAPVKPDGTIDSWIQSPNNLLIARQRHTTVAHNGYLYVVGGNAAGNPQATVQFAKINSDGSIDPWQFNTPMSVGRRRHTSVIHNNRLYVIGGSNPGYNTVYSAPIDPLTGVLGTWLLSPEVMPLPVYFQSSVLVGDYLYIMGGTNDNVTSSTSVWYARLNGDGTTDPWITSPHLLPSGVFAGVAFEKNGYITLLSGAEIISPLTPKSTTFYTRILPDNSLSPWSTHSVNSPLTTTRSALTSSGGLVYFAGGRDVVNTMLSEIYLAQDSQFSIVYNYITGVSSNTKIVDIATGDTLNSGSDGRQKASDEFAAKIYKNNYPVAEVIVKMEDDLDWSNTYFDTDVASKKSVAHNLFAAPGLVGSYKLYVPRRTNDNTVTICPGAADLNSVSSTCPGKYSLDATSPNVQKVSDGSELYWSVSGLSGTGGYSEYINITTAPAAVPTPTGKILVETGNNILPISILAAYFLLMSCHMIYCYYD